MLRLTLFLSLILLNGCAVLQINQRQSSSVIDAEPHQLPRADWHFLSTDLNLKSFVYTPFFIDEQKLTLYTGGYGVNPNNAVLLLNADLPEKTELSEKIIIKTGPDFENYNYFRAPRVAKNGSELWMLVEVSGCYTGCDSAKYPKSLAVYHSDNMGTDWKFLDYVQVDGNRYVAQWFGHTGLIFNPEGSHELDLVDLTKNRFITIGENKNILVSADGINYKSISMNHPFAKDRLVFASIAKTPHGYHMMTCANWSDIYYTTTVRHLFSKDLVNWYVIESNSYLKNPKFYKGIHLSYDEKSQKLWAISPCGSSEACGFLAWLDPIDYLNPTPDQNNKNTIPTGEFIHYNGKTAMIIDHVTNEKTNITTYKIRFSDGVYDTGYKQEMFIFPLADYTRQGCLEKENTKLCVGDTVYVNDALATIMGFRDKDPANIKYAVKFITGVIDSGYPITMIKLP